MKQQAYNSGTEKSESEQLDAKFIPLATGRQIMCWLPAAP